MMTSMRPLLNRRLGYTFFSLAVIYILFIDGFIRPRTKVLTIKDFDHSDFGIMPSKSTTASQHGNSTRILLVSAMFPLSKSKHSTKDYANWLNRFLGPLTTDIYMYTTPDFAETLAEIRGPLPITIDTSYSSPFQVPPLMGLEETYTKMNNMDNEKWHHSPGLYAVWNAKPYLLQMALRKLADKKIYYDYAFWNDGGSFRWSNVYKNWPDPGRIEQVWEEASTLTGKDKNDLLFFPIFQLPEEKLSNWIEEMGPINPVHWVWQFKAISEGSFFSQLFNHLLTFYIGSFFGGSQSTIEWFTRIFYAYHDHYLQHGLFVGIDQNVFNALFLLFPERIFTVWLNDPLAPAHQGITPSPSMIRLERGYLGECGAEWYYYQFWFADRATRDTMRKIWLSEERWRIWGWWHAREPCRLTRAISMMEVLRRSFGDAWKPPRKTVIIPP